MTETCTDTKRLRVGFKGSIIRQTLGVLHTAGKLYERMILNRIESTVEERQGLTEMQFGFRKAKSTLHEIQEVGKGVQSIYKMCPSHSGFCVVVALDAKNALNLLGWENIYISFKECFQNTYVLFTHKNASTIPPRVGSSKFGRTSPTHSN